MLVVFLGTLFHWKRKETRALNEQHLPRRFTNDDSQGPSNLSRRLASGARPIANFSRARSAGGYAYGSLDLPRRVVEYAAPWTKRLP